MGSMRATGALLAVAIVSGLVSGCSKPAGELYEDVNIPGLLEAQPGAYELYSSATNPIDIVTRGQNFVVLRQGKSMIIAAGDTLQTKLDAFRGQDYSLIGRRMGQPKIWFAVDAIVQEDKRVMNIGQSAEKTFPSYEEFDPATVERFAPVDLALYDFDKERKMSRELLDKDVRIRGPLSEVDLGNGVIRYLIESRNLKVELSPVGPNMKYFLDMSRGEGVDFVGYGRLTSIFPFDDGTDNDRGSSQIIGAFHPEMYRYSRDILVRNVLP